MIKSSFLRLDLEGVGRGRKLGDIAIRIGKVINSNAMLPRLRSVPHVYKSLIVPHIQLSVQSMPRLPLPYTKNDADSIPSPSISSRVVAIIDNSHPTLSLPTSPQPSSPSHQTVHSPSQTNALTTPSHHAHSRSHEPTLALPSTPTVP